MYRSQRYVWSQVYADYMPCLQEFRPGMFLSCNWSVQVQIILGLNFEKQEKLVDLHSDPIRFPFSTNCVSPNDWGPQVLEATKSCGLKFRPGPFARASLLLIYTLCAGSINRTRANFSIKIQTRHASFLNKPNARKLLYQNSDPARFFPQ